MSPFDDRPAWTDAIDNPYLHGLHAPTVRETKALDLPVEGELPEGLYGAYVRNGPNAVHAPNNLYHWFDGDGMVHGLYFRDGRVEYRSRFVQTQGLADETEAGRSIWPGVMGPFDFDLPRHFMKDTANTDVILHGDRLLALWYLCGAPYDLDPRTLETRGVADFGGRWSSTVSAHPKVDERTGELVFFTLSDFEPPYMHYGVVGADGVLAHTIPIDLPGARAPHDITLTERFSIVHDFPLFHDPAVLREHGYRVARFYRDLPSRFGVLPRRGGTDDVRWFEFEAGYVLHMVNAWEEGDWIVMDGCFQPDPTIRRRPEEGELASMLGYLRIRAHLHRWEMNLATGETRERPLDDLNVEFCLPDTRRYGQKTRYSWHQHIPVDSYTVEFHALVKYDHSDGSCVRFDYEPGWIASESPFAPHIGATDEDDGWIVTIATHRDTGASEGWVFEAQEIERGPIARIPLPTRVPSGFHAKWLPGERLWNGAV
ncbi:MAG: carotenoid oxygenase family protein [Myxococcales bacterium]|nr:carotenoid oxygenase family protein [Myxococcales bacterium]